MECEEAFDKVKNYLASTPILAIFDREKPIHIYTDASLEGIGAVLKQPQNNGSEKPVAYFSQKLNLYQKGKKAKRPYILNALQFGRQSDIGNIG